MLPQLAHSLPAACALLTRAVYAVHVHQPVQQPTGETIMNNTEHLILALEFAEKSGQTSLTFMVGKYTGNGSSVVAALRRRGFAVIKLPAGGVSCYKLSRI
jgi:hypothetical protein